MRLPAILKSGRLDAIKVYLSFICPRAHQSLFRHLGIRQAVAQCFPFDPLGHQRMKRGESISGKKLFRLATNL
jgi:hypothetical protein